MSLSELFNDQSNLRHIEHQNQITKAFQILEHHQEKWKNVGIPTVGFDNETQSAFIKLEQIQQNPTLFENLKI